MILQQRTLSNRWVEHIRKHFLSQSDVPGILSKALIEFIGCMMFHFIGSIAPTALANGIVLIPIVYYTAKISGAHINPAVTLTFCLLGHTSPFELLVYWFAQVFGCAVGALWIAALTNLHVSENIAVYRSLTTTGPHIDGCFVPLSTLSAAQVYGWETLGTFCFIVPIFSVVWYTQNKKGYGNTGPLIVGLSLFASALAAGPFTGASFNPARSLGSPIVFNCPNSHLHYYILGQLTGAISSCIAIMPWYGISSSPWYAMCLPVWLHKVTLNNSRSLRLKIGNQDAIDAATLASQISNCGTEQANSIAGESRNRLPIVTTVLSV